MERWTTDTRLNPKLLQRTFLFRIEPTVHRGDTPGSGLQAKRSVVPYYLPYKPSVILRMGFLVSEKFSRGTGYLKLKPGIIDKLDSSTLSDSEFKGVDVLSLLLQVE